MPRSFDRNVLEFFLSSEPDVESGPAAWGLVGQGWAGWLGAGFGDSIIPETETGV